ncbi:MAG: hypothetical protein AAF213_12530, partial [Pseudomonadota bacterium]
FLRPDSVDTVTLEAIGAATSQAKLTQESAGPGIQVAGLVQRIDAVLKRDGASVDPAIKDMTGFLKRIGPDLSMIVGQDLGSEYGHGKVRSMVRNNAGPAEELFKRRFADSEVPAQATQAADVHTNVTNHLQARRQL